MIDRLLGAKASMQDLLYDSDYSPEQAVSGCQYFNVDSPNLAVIFPPWHGGKTAMGRLAQRLVAADWAVCSYSFSDHILEPDVERVKASFETVQRSVVTDLKRLLQAKDYKQIHLIGFSLGNVALALVASQFDEFTKATMVAAGSNFAMSMWEGSRTQRLRQLMMERAISAKELNVAWENLAPKIHAAAFRGKPVKIIRSLSDEIIPANYQKEMEDSLRSSGALVESKPTRLGHYLTIGRYCYFAKV